MVPRGWQVAAEHYLDNFFQTRRRRSSTMTRPIVAQQLKEDVDWRKEVAEKNWFGVRVAGGRRINWVTWATKRREN
jgi:hypothetical protein